MQQIRWNSGGSRGGANSQRVYIVKIASSLYMFSILLFYYLQGIAPAFIMTLILGSYTDRGGRKKILYFPIIGNLIRVAIILFMVNLEWPVNTILISSFIAGAFGGTQTLFTVCYSYIADITNEEKRSFRWVSVYWSNGRFLCPVMTILKYVDGWYYIWGIGETWVIAIKKHYSFLWAYPKNISAY